MSRSFGHQFLMCVKEGNILEVDVTAFACAVGSSARNMFVCIKHKKCCSANVCREERNEIDGKEDLESSLDALEKGMKIMEVKQ